MRLVIPEVPRSPNGPKGTIRMHWRARGKYNAYWRTLVRSQVFALYPCQKRMRVQISQMRGKLMDKDNLFASCKPILDALVKLELIRDDNAEWCDFDCTQTTGKERWTIIDFEECK